jgi:hypothetical protein
VLSQLEDAALIEKRRVLRLLVETNTDLPSILDKPVIPTVPPERQAIITILNTHKFMASGVRDRAFEERTYKRLFYTNVINDWRHLRAFVDKYRTKGGRTNYQDFQWLAERWAKNPLKDDRRSK